MQHKLKASTVSLHLMEDLKEKLGFQNYHSCPQPLYVCIYIYIYICKYIYNGCGYIYNGIYMCVYVYYILYISISISIYLYISLSLYIYVEDISLYI